MAHLLAAFLVASVALAACGSSTKTTSPSSAGSSGNGGGAVTVTIKNYMFMPMSFTVSPGAKITVTNEDGVAHTLTAASGGKASFDTGNIDAKQTKTVTAPSAPGTYKYDCTIHPFMTGTLTVS